MTYHFRARVEERLRVVVTHAHVVNEDADVEAANGLLDPGNVPLGARGKVNVDDLGSNPLVLGLDVRGHVLQLERGSTHLQNKTCRRVSTGEGHI